MKKIGEGMVSEAFLEKGRVILVGRRPDAPKIYKELKANLDFFQGKIKSLKIPSNAQIIELSGKYPLGAITFDYVPGTPLIEKIATCTDNQKFAIGKKLAEFITEITSLAPRIGDSKEKEIEKNCAKFANAINLIAPHLSCSETEKLNTISVHYRAFLQKSNFCMTHGDLHFENLILDDNNNLVGVIDFGNVEYYVPEIEFMWMQGFNDSRYKGEQTIFDAMIGNYANKLNLNDIKLVRLVGSIRFFKHIVQTYQHLLDESIPDLRQLLAKFTLIPK